MSAEQVLPKISFDKLAASYVADEAETLTGLITLTKLNEADRATISAAALELVATLRSDGQPVPLMDALLQEYGLSTEEGVALMRLSEALIRTPDFATSRKLVRDKLIDADWHASRRAGSRQVGDSPPVISLPSLAIACLALR